MLNRVILMGRLTRDPELRHTPSGVAVATFSLAVERDFKDKTTGEKATDFIDVVAWRQTGEFVSRYFTKGRMAVVDGRIQTRRYTDRDGNNRTAFEVVADSVYFCDKKDPMDELEAFAKKNGIPAVDSPYDPGDDFEAIDDQDDLPF